MTTAQTFPQGLADGTAITTGNSSTGSQSSMTIALGTGAVLVADVDVAVPNCQGNVGETWLFTNGSVGSFASYTVSETTHSAEKAAHQWAGAVMPGVIDRCIDIRNASGTACRLSVSATNFPYVEDTTGTIATGTTALTPGNWYRFELAITISAGSATVNWGVYDDNDATAIPGNSGSLSGKNTGSATITNVRHISNATNAGGAWGKNCCAFAHASQSTLIGGVAGSAIPVSLTMPACAPTFMTGRGNQLGIANYGVARTFLAGRNPVLSIGGTGSVHFQMPPCRPVFLSGRNPALGGVTVIPPAAQPAQARNSLIYDTLQLLGGAGAVYNITTGNRDLGDPVAISDTVASDFIDGQLVTGTFLGNRTVVLDVLITAASRLGLSAATEALMSLVYDPTPLTLTWSPLNGLPLIFDTYRGNAAITWSGPMEAQFGRVIQITLPAAPTGRSAQRQTIAGSSGAVTVMDFTNPSAFTYVRPLASDATVYGNLLAANPALVGSVPMPTVGANHGPVTTNPYPVAGSGSTQVDAQPYCWQAAYTYTYITGGAGGGVLGGGGSGQTGTVNIPAQGIFAARVDSGVVSLNLTGTPNLTVPVYVSAAATPSGLQPELAAYVTLTDSHAVTASFAMAAGPAVADWTHFTLDLTTATTLDLAHITACSLTVAGGRIYSYTTGMATVPMVLGKMQAFPATSTLVTTTRGSVLRFANVLGSAPAPVQFSIDAGGTLMPGMLIYRAPFGTPLTTPILLAIPDGESGTTLTPSTFDGTYRLILAVAAANPGYTATIQQNLGGAPIAGAVVTTQPGVAFGTNYIDLGEVTLPLVDVPSQVTGTSYTFVYSNNGATDLIFADTTGRLLWVPAFAPVAYFTADEATAAGLGGVWGGQLADGTDAGSLLGNVVPPQISGALTLAPGDNYLLVHCPSGLPSNIKATYAPRWFAERSA